jgi:hypothetical protein
MSASAGPNNVEDGLVFYYDMSNTQKSWNGKPTVNYITSPTEEMARGEFGQYRDLAPTFNTYGLVPYSLSMDIKVNKPGSVLVYMQNGSSTKYGFVSSNINATTEYQRFYFNNLTPVISTPSDTAATLATYTGYGSGVTPTVKNIQLELGTFATPFVNGTRSNTQAIIDLTRNNTVTANSLTYASDGTFSFNGTTDYMSLATPPLITNQITLEGWVKLNSTTAFNAWMFGREGAYRVLYSSNAFSWICATTNNGWYTAGTAISASGVTPHVQTYHVVVTYDGSNNRIYVNGDLRTTGSAISGNVLSSNPYIIMQDGSSDVNIDSGKGTIYAHKIYNRALSAAEVQQNFAAHRSRYGI